MKIKLFNELSKVKLIQILFMIITSLSISFI